MAKPWPVLLMVRQAGLGGTERQTAETARALDRLEFNPHVVCFREGGIRRRELEQAGIPVLTLPVQSLLGISAIRGAHQLRRYVREHSIQLVHTFDTPSNLFGVPAARWAGAPAVLSSQRAYRELTPSFARGLLRATDRLADGIVVNCKAMARHMIEDEGVDPKRVLLCYNGIDTSVFAPGPSPLRSQQLHGVDLLIGVVCGVREEKRLDLLLEAFARTAGPRRMLVIVGSGPAQREIEALADRLNIRPYCRFEPTTQSVVEWLRAIDIFVLPSRSEALSNSLMEAMACGRAVVASDVGGNPELVIHEETGLLFPGGDAAALAGALQRLAGDANLRASLGQRAAGFIRERFSLAAAARRMGEIYAETLARG